MGGLYGQTAGRDVFAFQENDLMTPQDAYLAEVIYTLGALQRLYTYFIEFLIA